jgi:copper chaperone
MEKMTLNVKGMSCRHCINSIEGNVGELNGVTNVKVNLDSGMLMWNLTPMKLLLIISKVQLTIKVIMSNKFE